MKTSKKILKYYSKIHARIMRARILEINLYIVLCES